MSAYVAVLPPVPALLPEYASQLDPLADLRQACRDAATWLTSRAPSRIVLLGDRPALLDSGAGAAQTTGERVARSILDDVAFTGEIVWGDLADAWPDDPVLVLANGSARRGEKAPGHLDERSFGFDAAIEAALAQGDPAALRALDVDLGSTLLATGTCALQTLGHVVDRQVRPTMFYAADPFGVRYWVVTWESAS